RLGSFARPWLDAASEELASTLSAIEIHELENMDAYLVALAPENSREGSDVDPKKLGLRMQARRPYTEPFLSDEKPWVGLDYPTQALAQDAGMTLAEFEDFHCGALLMDWEALGKDLERIASRVDAAGPVRL